MLKFRVAVVVCLSVHNPERLAELTWYIRRQVRSCRASPRHSEKREPLEGWPLICMYMYSTLLAY